MLVASASVGLIAPIAVQANDINIEDMNKINFDKTKTASVYGKRSFVYDFLSSMRQKVNDPLGKRKRD